MFSPVAPSPPPAAVFLADMAGAGTPRPSAPMPHVENEGGGSYLQKRGEKEERRGEGGRWGGGEACVIALIFFLYN